jgi:hypothetical protein
MQDFHVTSYNHRYRLGFDFKLNVGKKDVTEVVGATERAAAAAKWKG